MTAMYQVEENVPLPDAIEPGVVETLEKLEVGQSVSIPLSKRSAFYYHAKGSTKRFKVRTKGQPEDTARVWRTA